MKKINLFLVFSLMLLLVSNVSSLGISPGRKIIDFLPSQEVSGSFKIINSENRQLSLSISIDGDLGERFILPEKIINLNPGEEKIVDYKFNLPEGLSPGNHIQEIVVSESSLSSEGSIGATVGVISQVYIKVPYPGKYAELEFNVESVEVGQNVLFSIIASNVGEESIEDLSAIIDIFDRDDNRIGTISSEKIKIPKGDKKSISVSWKADVEAGEYLARAKISYAEENIELEKDFRIGVETLDLNSVIVKQYSLGGIAKFEMNVQSKWSEDISNVYSQTNVFDSNKKMIADFKSPTDDIFALANQTLFSYWDTEGIKEGIYDAVIYLRYGEKFSKRDVQFEVGKNNLRTLGLGYVISGTQPLNNNTTIILVAVIVILVLLNFLWFVIFRRKFKK